MTTVEFDAHIDRLAQESLGKQDSTLSTEREKALDFYHGRPLGNEQEGRSHVVSRDVMEAVEWALPSLLRVFASSDVVKFVPRGPEDEKQAEQESLYVSYTFMEENGGFLVLYSWMKDALLQKNGYVISTFEKRKEIEDSEYTGLTLEQLAVLMDDLGRDERTEVKVLEKDERFEKITVQTDKGPQEQRIPVYDVKLRVTTETGKVQVEGIPPEEMLVHPTTKHDINKSVFVGRLVTKTRSDLIAEGFERSVVEEMTDYTLDGSEDEPSARDTVEESQNSSDELDQEVRLLDAYVLIDFDNDGIAERRHVLRHGGGTIVNDPTDCVPVSYLTPLPVPHRHIGVSLADLVADIQIIKTTLLRQLLDNTYLTNNKRLAVDRNAVNIADLMVNRPGGIVRVNGSPASAILPLDVAPIINRIAPVIEYFDTVKEARAGVGRMTNGLDPNVLSDATKGAYMAAASNASARLEAIARIFAETGIRDLMMKIHALLRKHQNWPKQTRLAGGWVTVNPSEWQSRADLKIEAGLGNNTRDDIRQSLLLMGQAQQQAAAAGIVLPKNVFNLASRFQRELGFESANFFTDPASEEWKQFQQQQQQNRQPDPLVQVANVKAQSDLQKAQINAEKQANSDRMQMQRFMQQQAHEMRKLMVEVADLKRKKQEDDRQFGLAVADTELKYAVDLAKEGIGAELAREDANQRAADRREAAGGRGAGGAGESGAEGGV